MLSIKNNIRWFYIYSFFAGLFFIVPIWVAFERKFLSFQEMALLEVIGTSILVAMQLPTGALADLIGRRNTMIIGWLLTAIGWIATGFSTNFMQFVISYGITNLGVAIYSGADTALVYDSLKEMGRVNEFQKISAKKSLIFQISISFGTLIAGYLYAFWNPLPYVLTGLTDIFLIFVLLKMVEPHIDSEKFTPKSYLQKNIDGFSEIFKNNHVLFLSLFYIIVGGITWTGQIFFNQIFASDIGMSILEKSWFFGVTRILNSVLIFQIVKIGFINKKRSFLFFPIVMMLAFLPGIFAGKLSGAFMVLLATFIATARFTILDRYTNAEFESRHRATALSTLSMFVSLIYIILMLLSSTLLKQLTSREMYSFLGVLTIIFALPVGIKLWKEAK